MKAGSIHQYESSFSLATGRYVQYLWRKTGEEYKEECLAPTLKSGNQTAMYWGCMSYNGLGPLEFIPGRMNAERYIQMLENLLPIAGKKLDLITDYIFMQDNAPCHTAHLVRKFFERKGLIILNHPAQSPDLCM